MTARVFVDSNVLVYERDSSEPEKQPLAEAWVRRLWETRSARVSYQVLHEYYVNVTTKLKPGLTTDEAQRDVRDLMAWKPLALDWTILDGAFTVEHRFRLSFWDALIVSAAQRAECPYLLTEDLQSGQDFDGVVVLNPFEQGPEKILGIPLA
jgi:predicted nucleic acid-binding protein